MIAAAAVVPRACVVLRSSRDDSRGAMIAVAIAAQQSYDDRNDESRRRGQPRAVP